MAARIKLRHLRFKRPTGTFPALVPVLFEGPRIKHKIDENEFVSRSLGVQLADDLQHIFVHGDSPAVLDNRRVADAGGAHNLASGGLLT